MKLKNEQGLLLKLDIQFFALGDNNDKPVQIFEKRYKELLEKIYGVTAVFGDFNPGGTLEALDGVQENAEAFTVKTSDIPVVLGTYNTGANVVFGTGADGDNRFGKITEVIFTNQTVPYAATWAFREGIDRHTVNNNFEFVVAQRLEMQAEAKAKLLDNYTGTFINTNAGKTQAIATMDSAGILAAFDALDIYFTNLETLRTPVVKASPELFNVIVNAAITTTGKNSNVNIDSNSISEFKGFRIEKVPSHKLPTGTAGLVYIPGCGKVFTGINTARTVEAINFDGRELQGSGKYGAFVPKDNKKAIAKLTFPAG